MNNRNIIFIIATAFIHLFVICTVLILFNGQCAAILVLLWTIFWVGYCANLQKYQEEIYNNATYMRLVLIGGPICWLTCPFAFRPSSYVKNSEPLLWIVLIKIYFTMETAFFKLMSILFDFAHSDQQQGAKSQEADK